MIHVENLCKRFGRVSAVRSVSFTCKNGAITTILGGNGSGKTTTLRMIAGALRPDEGRVLIDDSIRVASDRTKALAKLGVVHDEFGLYPRLTVRENIRFAAELNGLSADVLRGAVQDAITLLELTDIQHRYAAGLSHGQRMKTALARAIVHRPPNIILDEPTRGLDIFAVRALRMILKRLRDQGTCLLMSSHAMAEVEELSDRLILMGDGVILAEGTVQEILRSASASNLERALVALSSRKLEPESAA